MHVCASASWVPGRPQSFPPGQAQAARRFFPFSLFLSRKEQTQTLKPTFHQPSSKLLPVRVVQGFDPQNNATILRKERSMRWMKGDVGLPSQPVHDFSPSPRRRLTRFSFSSWQGGMLLGGGTAWRRPPAPHHSFKWISPSVAGRGLSLRRCCWRNWRWRPRPCPRCPRRPPTCGCGASGRGHWPAGAHRCGPPYGRLDSAL